MHPTWLENDSGWTQDTAEYCSSMYEEDGDNGPATNLLKACTLTRS